MSRSPLFYPLQRGADADGGGAADLQTDVMRFMAIISLCLVAIFSLMQSIPPPQTPVSQEQTTTQPATPPPPARTTVSREAQHDPPSATRLTRPALTRSVADDNVVSLQRPAASPPATTDAKQTVAADAPPSQSSAGTTPDKGFTLRFETDRALTELVRSELIGLYLISNSAAFRLHIDTNDLSFWPASIPSQFHEMDEATVPALVTAAALRHDRSMAATGKWAVTLPTTMAKKLHQYLAEFDGGSLIINTSGELLLEP